MASAKARTCCGVTAVAGCLIDFSKISSEWLGNTAKILSAAHGSNSNINLATSCREDG